MILSDEFKYEQHFNNGNFVLKSLFIMLGGALLGSANFILKVITAENNNEIVTIDYEILIDNLKYSYLLFLIGLISALVSSLFNYFANRLALEGKTNACLVYMAIVFGVLGFIMLIAGLFFILPVFNSLLFSN